MLVEKVQIAGGGIAGLAAGVALRDRGVEVEIHEQFEQLQAGRPASPSGPTRSRG